MRPLLNSIDHIVLTVDSIGATVDFYTRVLGMTAGRIHASDGTARTALNFGRQKINLHVLGSEFEPKAIVPAAGSADLCFLTDASLDDWMRHLAEEGVALVEGPVRKTGATGALISIYIRDPDGNLIEIARPV